MTGRVAAAVLSVCSAFAAEVKLSELPALTAPASGDILPIVDVSANATKGITWADLFRSPTMITPVLGAATATSINGLTLTTSTGTVTISNAKTFAVSNSLTLAGADGSTLNVGTGGTLGTAAFTAATAYAPAAGSTSITTLGTIGTGTWQGTTIAAAYLGSGSSISSKFLRGDNTWQTLGAGSGDLLAANNLSDLASAATARTNLGLAIGTNVQAFDADLTSWASKTAPSGVAVGTTDTQALSAKTVACSAALGTDDTLEGATITGLNNSGGASQWDAVYLNGSSAWVAADANGSGTYPCRGLATATASNGAASTVLTHGTARNDAWNWTPGGAVYLSTTAAGLTQTAPSGSGEIVQVVGFALTADILFVNITGEYLTLE